MGTQIESKEPSSPALSGEGTPRSRSRRTSLLSPRKKKDQTPRTSPKNGRFRQTSLAPDEAEDGFYDGDLYEQMQQEKVRYPGASNWARDEERLFEILFMRQDLPMLPSTWDVDFSGVPISDVVFATSGDCPAIIYAHDKDFRATTALIRLIDLTSKVRAHVQTGLRPKVPGLIKRELDKYINWASQDGGYAHLRIVPNIITEVVDITMAEADITSHIQKRMQALARLQREFLGADGGSDFWDVVKPSILKSPVVKLEPEEDSPQRWKSAPASKGPETEELSPDELSTDGPPFDGVAVKTEAAPKKRRLFHSPPAAEVDELSSPNERRKRQKTKPAASPTTKGDQKADAAPRVKKPPTPVAPSTPPKSAYRRHPPVVYGLFILNTSVLLLTIDAAKEDDAYVSFHVETDLQDPHQGIWNALTLAIAVCLARDELMERVEDFEKLPVEEDSDPDA